MPSSPEGDCMFSYYSDKLSADRLKCCYDRAPLSVQRYLDAVPSLRRTGR